jgi:predicted phage baseplate assembly protein
MTLETPTLDDRRFQDLVDEAKRRIADRCPEWTDHNVSDPGVTLIELFAWMTDQLIYRLNRVPDRLYVKFLELIGVSRAPPQAATAEVTFWLARPVETQVAVPKGTEVATVRTELEPAIVFTVVKLLEIVPCAATGARSIDSGGEVTVHDRALRSGEGFLAFSDPPVVGDAVHVVLSNVVPSCAIRIRLECDEAFGQGVDPQRPPLTWEAWNGKRWRHCDFTDQTGGLNHDGDVVVHVPHDHAVQDEDHGRAELRCRVLGAQPNQPTYDQSPRITALTAATVGGNASAAHAELVINERLASSSGLPGQRFSLLRRPLVADDEPLVVESRVAGNAEEWEEVDTFAESGPDDRHFTVDRTTGTVVLGPAVRDPRDGRLQHYGHTPGRGADLYLREYRTGGGQDGNVARGALRVLKSAIPYVARVENRAAATGGTDPETVEDAKIRGSLELHQIDRAVTPEDYERLAKTAGVGIDRVICIPADAEAQAPARVFVVSHARLAPDGTIDPPDLVPTDDELERVQRYLEERRVLGARFVVQPAHFQGVQVNALVQLLPGVQAKDVVPASIAALNRYLNPLTGGAKGNGWPFGRPVYSGEAQLVLQRVRGVELVQELKLFAVDVASGQRGRAQQRIEVEPHSVVVSHEHMVAVADQT